MEYFYSVVLVLLLPSGTKMSLLPQSVSFYVQNQDMKNILDNMDVYVLPVMNPDGYQYTWTTVRMRKTELVFRKQRRSVI